MAKNLKRKTVAARCFNVDTATSNVKQQITKKTTLAEATVKTQTSGYRKSKVSCTIRVPNELVGKVAALVAAYRTEQLSHPDTW